MDGRADSRGKGLPTRHRRAGLLAGAVLAALAALAALAGGCGGAETGRAAQPLSDSERVKLEHDRRLLEDRYAEALYRLRRFEAQDLDGQLRSSARQIEALEADLARVDQTLALLEEQRKTLLARMELGPVGSATGAGPSSGPEGKDWAEQADGVRQMKAVAEVDRVSVQRRLAEAREAQADLRRLAAQRDILSREALAQEKRLLELARRLQ